MRYVAMVNGEEYTVAVEEGAMVDINGDRHSFRLEPIDSGVLFCLIVDDRPYEVFVEADGRGYAVTIDGNRYDVEVQEHYMRSLRDRLGEGAGETAEETVRSPMPGTVVAVPVDEGQTVHACQPLAILEAMKMEMEIKAPRRGVVSRMYVDVGDAVQLGDPVGSIDSRPNN